MYVQEGALPLSDNPYWVFVSFLYAWIAADIANRFAGVSQNWSKYQRLNVGWWFVPVASHLTLAGFVVGTSWLGLTGALKHDIDITPLEGGVIAATSLLLIVDFWILATYFAFVRVVNEARLPHYQAEIGTFYSRQPAYWISCILTLYVVWDILAYFAIPCWIGHRGHFCVISWLALLVAIASGITLIRFTYFRDRVAHFKTKCVSLSALIFVCVYIAVPWQSDPDVATSLWNRSWMSPSCALLALGALWGLKRIGAYHPFCVLSADASLVALLLFYRALKDLACPSPFDAPLPIPTQVARLFCSWNGDWRPGFAIVSLTLFVLLGGIAAYKGGSPRPGGGTGARWAPEHFSRDRR